MNHLKNSLWLAKFEFKHSYKNLLLLIPIILLVIIFIQSLVPNYLDQSTMGLDMIMLLTFVLLSQMTRPKDFQLQKMQGTFYAAPYIIALNQLPIPKKLIVRYRFLSYIIIYSLFVFFIFIGLYAVLEDSVSGLSYLVFAFLWYCIGIYLGLVTPAFEAASNMIVNIVVSIVIAPILVIINTFLFYKAFFQDGFFGWTMYVANEHPFWSLFISFLLAVIGWIFWQKRMEQKMKRADYL